MFLGHDATWWGIALALVALALMFPVSLLGNVLTPIVMNWFATWSRASLEKRIDKLEKQLVEFEKYPPIDEAQDRIIWGIKALRMALLSATSAVIIVVYLGVSAVANTSTVAFKTFEGVAVGILVANFVQTFAIRYTKDFRYWRSPINRSTLRKAIAELKCIRAKWDQQN